MGFNLIFVMIVKPIVFWALFTIAAFYNLDIEKLDMKMAFLHDILNQLFDVKILRRYNGNAKTRYVN